MTDFPDFRKDAEKLIEIHRLSNEVAGEVMRATSLFAPINGPHEGYGVIKEEFDEFWDEVKKYNLNKNRDTRPQMRAELIQLAAMCLRTIHDVIDANCGSCGALNGKNHNYDCPDAQD